MTDTTYEETERRERVTPSRRYERDALRLLEEARSEYPDNLTEDHIWEMSHDLREKFGKASVEISETEKFSKVMKEFEKLARSYDYEISGSKERDEARQAEDSARQVAEYEAAQQEFMANSELVEQTLEDADVHGTHLCDLTNPETRAAIVKNVNQNKTLKWGERKTRNKETTLGNEATREEIAWKKHEDQW